MSNRFEDLDPAFEPIARQIILDAQERITEQFPGSVIRPAVTFRSLSGQAEARAAGKSDLTIGMHNFGRAMDVAVIGPNGDYILDGRDRRYTIFGQVATEHGCIWGGIWTNRPSGKPPDYDHCEVRMVGTPLQLGAWLDAHHVVTA
jgi:hypothetical protein